MIDAMFENDVIVVGAGQAGLAAAYHLVRSGLRPILVDASDQGGGSWPRYYDSLTLFSPAQFSSLPGLSFPGDPRHYPRRDAVVDYLYSYRRHLGVDVMREHVVDYLRPTKRGFEAVGEGLYLTAARAIVATGSFTRPFSPKLARMELFRGRMLHSADYRSPRGFEGQRVAVVGGGNSAIQIAHELSGTADVTVFTRRSISWQRQKLLGLDFHWWLINSGADRSRWLDKVLRGAVPVVDDGGFRRAFRSGQIRRRPMFDSFHPDGVQWQNGEWQRIDSLIFATGYQPDTSILDPTVAVDASGQILHRQGVSTTVPGLGFVGLPHQRSFSSATLRGVGADALHVVDAIAGTGPRRRKVSVFVSNRAR